MIFQSFSPRRGRMVNVIKALIVEDNLELARYIRPTMQKRTI